MFELSTNIPPPEMIGDLENLSPQAAGNQHAAASLHTKLKSLKTGNVPLAAQNASQINNVTVSRGDEPHQIFQVHWNENQQKFSVKETPSAVVSSNSSDQEKRPASLNKEAIEGILNECVQRDKEARRADRYSLEEQDPSDLLKNLLSRGSASITVAQQGEETLLYVTPNAPGAKSSSPINNSSPTSITATFDTPITSVNANQSILLYGFDKPRLEMKQALKGAFPSTKLETINDYNACIEIGLGFGFRKYCLFIQNLKQRIPGQLFDLKRIGDYLRHKRETTLTVKKVQSWINFLTFNCQEFDFSKKLTTFSEKAQFIAKNFYAITEESTGISDQLRRACRNNDWNYIIAKLDKALNLLAEMGAEFNKTTPFDTEVFEQKHKRLTLDQKIALDSILSRAFLRKTSKLGLSFAQEQNSTVFMAWKLPDYFQVVVPPTSPPTLPSHAITASSSSLITSSHSAFAASSSSSPEPSNLLQAFHHYTEVKPYKIPQFRSIAGTGLDVESITASEKRQLGRLRQKGIAPKYSLIIAVTPLSTPPSTRPPTPLSQFTPPQGTVFAGGKATSVTAVTPSINRSYLSVAKSDAK
ncbi:MAG: hypothetical protein A3F67_10135 [Verrucomicrobia bacterium RIFCSPHIGHO2_12_FULL_41_10]|nr:MAG: hypothetical protein A3F67_10135 [Verrucomicrobia bacterium RIFCSPHIGHO2_12_FULL_41_10]HLB33834.1 hypothetical protein [Chthoniobacterales bacterium]